MKSKIEPLLSALCEIKNGLTCYNLLNIIRENGDLFYSVFYPGNVFTWALRFSRKLSQLYSVTQGRTRKSLK